MPNVGPLEIILLLIFALVILGPKRLPEVGRSVGRGMREFKEAITGESEPEEEEHPHLTPAAAVPPPSAASAEAPEKPGEVQAAEPGSRPSV